MNGKRVKINLKPEEINPQEYAEIIQKMADAPEIKEMFDKADEGAKKSLRASIENAKSIGVPITEKNVLGFLVHFSIEQADMLCDKAYGYSKDQLASIMSQVMLRYYKTIYELIQAEDAVNGFKN